jgi:hypothetical protein
MDIEIEIDIEIDIDMEIAKEIEIEMQMEKNIEIDIESVSEYTDNNSSFISNTDLQELGVDMKNTYKRRKKRKQTSGKNAISLDI